MPLPSVNATWGLPIRTSEGGRREGKSQQEHSHPLTYSSTATEFHLDLDCSGVELKQLVKQQKINLQEF